MLKRMVSKYGLMSLLGLILCSCVNDVDFDQADTLQVSPVMDVSLIYFEESVDRFYDESGVEQTVVRDSVRVEIFSDDFVVDNLQRAEFLFETTNSINRAFEARIDFLDDDDAEQYVVEFSVPESPTNQSQVLIHEEIFENDLLVDLKTTTKLVLTFTMQASDDGSVLTDDSVGDLRLRSKGKFFINLISPE